MRHVRQVACSVFCMQLGMVMCWLAEAGRGWQRLAEAGESLDSEKGKFISLERSDSLIGGSGLEIPLLGKSTKRVPRDLIAP